ncbi:MAG: DUF2071 domain-containing protein [Acidobacteriota bacterium]
MAVSSEPSVRQELAESLRRPFLTARWESLLLLNYECPRELLEPLVPHGTVLDPWQGTPLVSLVGFMFRDTRVAGIGFPWHRTFEEVNLRFYVLRTTPEGEARRSVVFIRELVPRWIIATIARLRYNEPYLAVPMDHHVDLNPKTGGEVSYSWRHQGTRYTLRGTAQGAMRDSAPGSEAEFITEHYWGYTRQPDGGTLEYRVAHPRWQIWELEDASFTGHSGKLYGTAFGEILTQPPRSAFLAWGSEVEVYQGRRLSDV